MCNCSSKHSRSNTCDNFIDTCSFQFLIEHVMKATKRSLLDTTAQTSTKKGFETLFFVNLYCSRPNWRITMKIRQLKTSFNNVERVRKESASQPWNRGYKEIREECWVEQILKVAKPSEVDIAAKCSFETGCDETFVKSTDAIVLVNVFARRQNIAKSVVMFMDVLQFIGRNH